MFVISKSPAYFWPVSIEQPEDGGRNKKQTFDVQLKRLTQSQIKDITIQIEKSETTDFKLCKEVIVGWRGVLDESNAEVPFSNGALDELLDIQGVAQAIVLALFESLSGSKRKN